MLNFLKYALNLYPEMINYFGKLRDILESNYPANRR